MAWESNLFLSRGSMSKSTDFLLKEVCNFVLLGVAKSVVSYLIDCYISDVVLISKCLELVLAYM